MSDDGDRHITSRELQAFKEILDEKFKSHRNQMLLYIGVAVGLIRFDVPDSLTAGVIVAAIAKGAITVFWRS